MSKLQEIRHFYRYQIRNEDITRKRADIRNLMLSALYADQNNCFLCTHHWVFSEPNPNIISLLAQIFNHQNICPAHAEPFFSKILELLFAFPQYYDKFITRNLGQSAGIYSRKVILLFEIIDNELLMEKSALQLQVLQSFKAKGQFVEYMLDTAYGLNQGYFQEEKETLGGFADLRRISYNTAFFVFQKYPLLFQDLLAEYPLSSMLRAATQQKLLLLYQLLGNIYTQSMNSPQEYRDMLPYLEKGILQQIRDIKTLLQPFQLQKQLFCMFRAMLGMTTLGVDTIKEIVWFCVGRVAKFWRQSADIMGYIKHIYEQKLNEDQREHLEADLRLLNQALQARQSLDSTMDLQII